MKIRLKCLKNEKEIITHIWKCTCNFNTKENPKNYWETEAGMNDINYSKYLEWKNKNI